MKSKKTKSVFITPGDLNGIGLEVTIKALSKVFLEPAFEATNLSKVFIWIQDKQLTDIKKLVRSISKKPVHRNALTERFLDRSVFLNEADLSSVLLSVSKKNSVVGKFNVFFIMSPKAPPFWVEESIRLCLEDTKNRILLTGPLSKPCIAKSGLKDIGHTDMIARITGHKNLSMFFIGKYFDLMLITGHIPVSEVEKKLTPDYLDLKKLNILSALNWSKAARVHVLGLNPHSGDGGLIGRFEKLILNPWLKKNRRLFTGPVVPDTAFCEYSGLSAKSEVKNKKLFVSLYHDQGLIAFKTVHGFDGVHMTLGSPIQRLSVDHGTAHDIWGQNKARPDSMLSCLRLALNL